MSHVVSATRTIELVRFQRCRDRPHWDVSDSWTACFMTQATATTPNTRPPVTAPIIPTTIKKMLSGRGNRSDTETAKSPMTIAPTGETEPAPSTRYQIASVMSGCL